MSVITSSPQATRTCLVFATLALLASGCSTQLAAAPPRSDAFEPYRVGAPDKLRVTILPAPLIKEDVVVRPDGMISIQLVGDVPAGGRTLMEIGSDVEQRISRFKRGAKVTVTLMSADSTAITMLGMVKNPRAFPLVKETRVAEAIGIVGGPNLFASRGKIRIVRSGGGETAVYTVDLNAIQAGDLRTNLLLSPGDIVYVPPTIWARVGFAINAILFPIQPLLGIATGVAANVIAPGGGN